MNDPFASIEYQRVTFGNPLPFTDFRIADALDKTYTTCPTCWLITACDCEN